MGKRIEEDRQDFKRIIEGHIRKSLKKFIKNGKMLGGRSKNGRIAVPIPKIDIPHIVYGENNDGGVGRGPGEKGDVIGKDDPNSGGGKSGEEMMVDIDLEEILKFMQEELKLPDLIPKENGTFEDIKIKYNNISLTGPNSLRHTRRTMLQALKRLSITGELDKLHYVPGLKDPIKLLTPINEDKRFRQYNEVRIQNSNAVCIFARDGSGSMDDEKCEVVSNMAWWIDVWLKRFYKKVERLFVWHDTEAKEVDEKQFYKLRNGGGTVCSSAFDLIASQFENRFQPAKWNIYVFYFTDGDNLESDNAKLVQIINEKFQVKDVNFVGITQILSHSYSRSVKQHIDVSINNSLLDDVNLRTTEILRNNDKEEQTLDAIRHLLRNPNYTGGQ